MPDYSLLLTALERSKHYLLSKAEWKL